jgi:hypothetical protein
MSRGRPPIFDERHLQAIRWFVVVLGYSDGIIAKILMVERSTISAARKSLNAPANFRKGSRATKKVLDLHNKH